MPSESTSAVGIKVLTIAPENSQKQLPRVQGLYVLCDQETLTPVAILDGAALTTLRTPAVSLSAVKSVLLANTEPIHIVVFGRGPQAIGHIHALTQTLAGQREIASITIGTRSAYENELGQRDGIDYVNVDSVEFSQRLARANVVVCATTAREPLFDSRLLLSSAVVIAVGSHEVDARELDSALMSSAQVVVEDIATALRECGDIVIPVGEGALTPTGLIPLSAVVTGHTALDPNKRVVFKSSGMSWEDLAIAYAIATKVAH